MKKILKYALNVLLIFSIVSCSSACKKFDWEAKPYVGDSKNKQLINSSGEVVMCDQPSFDTYTCFDADNLAELKTAIGDVKMSKKIRERINSVFESVIRKH